MKERTGLVFSIASENRPVRGCTVSRKIWSAGGEYICCFSLAESTDISPELYDYHKLLIAADGELKVRIPALEISANMHAGDCLFTPVGTPVGIKTQRGAVYTEISFGRQIKMNSALKPGEIFSLADLVPYQEGRIVNMDLSHSEKIKFALMAFDEGTGLEEHAAPGEALIFALEGKGLIGYEGQAHPIKAGENFIFAAGGKHWVKADGKFKMALLLHLE